MTRYTPLVAALLTACLSAVGPEDLPLLRTEGTAYQLNATSFGFETSVPYSFTNRTGSTISLPNCRGGIRLRLERHDDGEWVTAWSPVHAACRSLPIEVKAGETLVDTVNLSAGLPNSGFYPAFDTAQPGGHYRIVWTRAFTSYDHDTGAGIPVDFVQRLSNTFELLMPH